MEQKLKRNILKSRPYFEEKAVCESSLAAQKQRMNELQTAISKAKAQYAASLRALEAISEEIHRRRREKLEVQLSNFTLLLHVIDITDLNLRSSEATLRPELQRIHSKE